MAIAPLTDATKTITTPGLFDAIKAGKTYEEWAKTAKAGDAMPSIAPAQVDSSVVNAVNKITSQDSPLMEAAKVEGLKVANSRGLLNSSIAAGAAQDAALRYAVPIASQEASQAAATNAQTRDFEYSTASQDRAQDFAGEQAALDRGLTREQANLDRQQQLTVQSRQNTFASGEAALDRELQQKIASWNLASSDRNAAAQFVTNMETMYQDQYRSIMANTDLSAEDRATYLASAKALRDQQLNLVEQMYDVDLNWGGTSYTTTTPATTASSSSTTASNYYGTDAMGNSVTMTDDGGSVLCTYFHAKGAIADRIYAADSAYGLTLPDEVRAGYWAWAVPLVSWLSSKPHPVAETVIGFLVVRWAREMGRVMGATPRGSIVGRAMRIIGEPVCAVIGSARAWLDRKQSPA